MKLQAQGGGDFPETVNEALIKAVNKINWSKDKKTLKIIFLVGDAPPHMDYKEVQYPETCKRAVAKRHHHQHGAVRQPRRDAEVVGRHLPAGEGRYVQIDAEGGPIVAVATPFDAELAKINASWPHTVVFGSKAGRHGQGIRRQRRRSWPLPPRPNGPPTPHRPQAAYDLMDNIKAAR